jgi:hypothetical protein
MLHQWTMRCQCALSMVSVVCVQLCLVTSAAVFAAPPPEPHSATASLGEGLRSYKQCGGWRSCCP